VNIERYFQDRVCELRTLAERGDPWIFLCASSFIEYLAKMAYGEPCGAKQYKEFLRTQFFVACPEYASFKYASGNLDLADQMYHVLRCGVVHSFSLFADARGLQNGGRNRSIVLGHRRRGRSHLYHVVHRKPQLDAALFIAQDFVEDIARVTNHLFAESRKRTPQGRDLRKKIQNWVAAHPPIGSLIV
jgi:hypothetical protein